MWGGGGAVFVEGRAASDGRGAGGDGGGDRADVGGGGNELRKSVSIDDKKNPPRWDVLRGLVRRLGPIVQGMATGLDGGTRTILRRDSIPTPTTHNLHPSKHNRHPPGAHEISPHVPPHSSIHIHPPTSPPTTHPSLPQEPHSPSRPATTLPRENAVIAHRRQYAPQHSAQHRMVVSYEIDGFEKD